MRISQAFPSKYLKADDLGDHQATVTIERMDMEVIKKDDGTEETKPVLYFAGKERGFVLNITNANLISKMYGEETNDWMGKPITLYVDHAIPFGNKIVSGIRVMIQQQAQPAPQPAPQHIPGGGMDDEIPF